MATSRKPLKKPGLFKNIMNRSMTGKPAEPMNVCYVTIYEPYATLDKKDVSKFFSGEMDGRFGGIGDAKAHNSSGAAESEGIAAIQRIFDSRNAEIKKGDIRRLVKESRLTSPEEKEPITLKDLRECAFWIFTMKGTSKEIDAIIAKRYSQKEAKKHGHYGAHGFGERILSAQDSSGRHLYTRGDYLNENKLDEPPDTNDLRP